MTRQERRRRAREHSDRPLVFEVIRGANEMAIRFADDLGVLFVSQVDGATVIEAAVIVDPDMPTSQRRAHHEELLRRSRALFGDEIEVHDPMGFRGGARAVAS